MNCSQSYGHWTLTYSQIISWVSAHFFAVVKGLHLYLDWLLDLFLWLCVRCCIWPPPKNSESKVVWRCSLFISNIVTVWIAMGWNDKECGLVVSWDVIHDMRRVCRDEEMWRSYLCQDSRSIREAKELLNKRQLQTPSHYVPSFRRQLKITFHIPRLPFSTVLLTTCLYLRQKTMALCYWDFWVFHKST